MTSEEIKQKFTELAEQYNVDLDSGYRAAAIIAGILDGIGDHVTSGFVLGLIASLYRCPTSPITAQGRRVFEAAFELGATPIEGEGSTN